jgi:hypothetical protein
VLVYKRREDILNYLGYRHITGIKEWDSLAKAKYLEQLRGTIVERKPERQFYALAKIIGSRSDYVARLITGYKIYEELDDENFFKIKDLNEDTIDFSILTTALTYSNITEFLGLSEPANLKLKGLNKARLKELTSWLYQKNAENKTRLGESRNLKQLNLVVAKKDALTAFRSGTPLLEAVRLTEAPTDIFRGAIQDSKARLIEAKTYSHKVTHPNSNDSDTLSDIAGIAGELRMLIKTRITDEQEA